jgi:UV DNA damage repair endonuclease
MGSLNGQRALEAAMSTWPTSVKPLTHVSNSKPEHLSYDAPVTKLRQHSDMLHTVPQYQFDANNKGAIDIDVEAKSKNHAIFHAVEKLGLLL